VVRGRLAWVGDSVDCPFLLEGETSLRSSLRSLRSSLRSLRSSLRSLQSDDHLPVRDLGEQIVEKMDVDQLWRTSPHASDIYR